MFKISNYSGAELGRFAELQRLSFSIQQDVSKTLQAGVDEKTVARELFSRYRAAGAGNFFHLPVVLFGERAALPGTWQVGHFFPKDKKLQEGDSVILDAAPLFDGYLVDTSYSFCFGHNSAHDQMMSDLLLEREEILNAVNQVTTFKKIAEAVHQRAESNGYQSAHEKHPGRVLGHRAGRWQTGGRIGWRRQGFDGMTLMWFLLNGKLADAGWKSRNPLWNRGDSSDQLPTDGLWLVEPHFGKDGVGAKWEEILIIENGRARWLQDDPPHVKDGKI